MSWATELAGFYLNRNEELVLDRSRARSPGPHPLLQGRLRRRGVPG